MSIARATTPIFTLTFTEQTLDLTQAANVYVTFSQGGKDLTKTGSDLGILPKEVSVYLSQKETLQFNEGVVRIQVNWTGSGGTRFCSKVATIVLSEQLLKKVVS